MSLPCCAGETFGNMSWLSPILNISSEASEFLSWATPASGSAGHCLHSHRRRQRGQRAGAQERAAGAPLALCCILPFSKLTSIIKTYHKNEPAGNGTQRLTMVPRGTQKTPSGTAKSPAELRSVGLWKGDNPPLPPRCFKGWR